MENPVQFMCHLRDIRADRRAPDGESILTLPRRAAVLRSAPGWFAGEILLQRADSFIDAKGGETKDMLTANENIC